MRKFLLLALSIAICIFLVACGGQKEEPLNNSKISTNNDGQEAISNEASKNNSTYEEELEKTKEAVQEMELYSDDTKYVFKTDENTTGIFYHNGNEITGYEVRVECETHELAELAKAEYLSESEGEDIKSVKTDGNYLIVDYGPEEYKDLTLDAIKMTYSMFQVLKGE